MAALCPEWVQTPLIAGAPHLQAGAITPEEVAEAAVNGLLSGQFLITTHPMTVRAFQARANSHDRWLGRVRALSRQTTEQLAGATRSRIHWRADMEFERKVIVVTGAASGIGKALAAAFVQEGATVVASDRNAELGAQEAAAIGALHPGGRGPGGGREEPDRRRAGA